MFFSSSYILYVFVQKVLYAIQRAKLLFFFIMAKIYESNF